MLKLVPSSDDLQVVVIDSFYDCTHDPVAMDLLRKLFAFKVNSYRQSYPYGIMPFGSTDLVGTHWVLCRTTGGELEPIMGMKTIDDARARTFKLDFPALGLVADPGLELHRMAIEKELRLARERNQNITYGGSWTIDPEVRRDRSMSEFCRRLTSAFIGHSMRIYDLEAFITFAILKFKVESFHAYMGMERLTGPDGEHLPAFAPTPTFGEQTSISVLRRGRESNEMKKDMAEFAALWERKIVLASDHSPLIYGRTADRKTA